ncbi:MAG: type II toxin-antitoxin system RelE/ParE family toxin [Nitrospira sp.]|nr:type II toxin-antitoxin system RelE/ParE family toxin [Nitrospiraceae bacterium]MBX3348841.1 type II toxin-antitoxin system RelE/ParE family toxin [Nitrospira sp.]
MTFRRAFRKQLGFSSSKFNKGKSRMIWKPMASIGSGVQEIRVRDDTGIYRVFYVAKFQEAVYVLHVFKKRSQKTARPDIELGKSRYADLLTWRREVGL